MAAMAVMVGVAWYHAVGSCAVHVEHVALPLRLLEHGVDRHLAPEQRAHQVGVHH
jgi:hypothetical protein